jgi:hypothetical protein
MFWSIVNMHFGAERVGYVQPSGVTQWAWLGPKSPWPDWAPVPEGGALTVRAHFESAPGEAATGFGDVALKDTTARGRDGYVRALERAGWTVDVGYFDTLSPDLPPHPMHICLIEAHKGAHSLLFTYDSAGGGRIAALHWSEGKLAMFRGSKPGSC